MIGSVPQAGGEPAQLDPDDPYPCGYLTDVTYADDLIPPRPCTLPAALQLDGGVEFTPSPADQMSSRLRGTPGGGRPAGRRRHGPR